MHNHVDRDLAHRHTHSESEVLGSKGTWKTK